MKKLVFLLLSIPVFMHAQVPQWLWGRSAAGSYYDDATSIAADADGNTIVTGWFNSNILNFDSGELINSSFSGTADFFLAKYDTDGNMVWLRSAGEEDGDAGLAVETDDDGNIFATGWFRSDQIVFGDYTLSNSYPGNPDIFIVKYDPDGNVLWAKNPVGSGFDQGYALSADHDGNIFLSGYFASDTIQFDAIKIANHINEDIFIAKYDADGNALWARGAGGTASDFGNAVATDNDGNVYVAGKYMSPSIGFSGTFFSTSGPSNIFLVKYNSDGEQQWVKSYGGTDVENAYSLATDNENNIYLSGSFRSPSLTFDAITITNGGLFDEDAFLVKLDEEGNVLWVDQGKGNSIDEAYSVSVRNDVIYVSGSFNSADFTWNGMPVDYPEVNFGPLFLVKLNTDGTVDCNTSLNTGGQLFTINDVVADAEGNAFITSYLSTPELVLGPDVLSNPLSPSTDIFFAKYTCEAVNAVSDVQDDISFYPNPVTNILNLHAPVPVNEIRIYAADGKLVLSGYPGVTDVKIPIDLPAGMYVAEILSGNAIVTEKFIAE